MGGIKTDSKGACASRVMPGILHPGTGAQERRSGQNAGNQCRVPRSMPGIWGGLRRAASLYRKAGTGAYRTCEGVKASWIQGQKKDAPQRHILFPMLLRSRGCTDPSQKRYLPISRSMSLNPSSTRRPVFTADSSSYPATSAAISVSPP